MQQDQTVSEMAEEALARQAKALANRSGHSLEDARQTVADTEAGRQLRALANGMYRHEKARHWQVSVLWGRAEERMMHLIGSEALSRFAAERRFSYLESYLERLEKRRSENFACTEFSKVGKARSATVGVPGTPGPRTG